MNVPKPNFSETEREQDPQVFARVVSTPPAPPWEQARVANLEARHGAPLPFSEVTVRIRRLAGWRPGAQGRFAIFYVRTKEIRGPFESLQQIEGRTLRIAFGGAGRRPPAELGGGVIILISLLASGAIIGGGGAVALRARAQVELELEQLETASAARLKEAQSLRDQNERLRALEALVGGGKPVGDVLDDLTWVATNKLPEARVDAVHWESGLLAVEVRGAGEPFGAPDRLVQKVEKPIRAGVWLWGVGGAATTSDRARPVAAEVR